MSFSRLAQTRHSYSFHHFPSQEGQPEDVADRAAWSWWKAKKWVLHITHRLFNRYGDPKKCEPGSPDAAFAAQFRDQCAVKFLEAHAALLGRYAEVGGRSPGLTFLCCGTAGVRSNGLS